MQEYICCNCERSFSLPPITENGFHFCSAECKIQYDNEEAMSKSGELTYELIRQMELPFIAP